MSRALVKSKRFCLGLAANEELAKSEAHLRSEDNKQIYLNTSGEEIRNNK